MKRVDIFLFLITQLLLLGILYLTLNLYSNSDLINSDGEDVIIEIVSGDIGSGELELSKPSPVPVYAGRKVTWRIGRTAVDVRWFDVEGKPGSKNVFKCDPPAGNRRHDAVGQLKNQSRKVEYEYSINWVDRHGEDHIYDPKIAVNPGSGFLKLLIYILYVLFAGLISFLTFRKR